MTLMRKDVRLKMLKFIRCIRRVMQGAQEEYAPTIHLLQIVLQVYN